jgi:Family of unknown function (DUF6492)
MSADLRSSLRSLKRQTLSSLATECLSPRSDEEVDVVIPVIRKDWDVLPFVLAAVKRCLKHPVRRIFLVGPERPESSMEDLPRQATFICENEISPLRREEIDLRPDGKDRSGWLLQQFVKLSVDDFCSCKHVLALDADTVLMRPQRYVKNGKMVLNVSEERYDPYYAQIRRVLPGLAISPFSFVCHQMMFQAEVLKSLRAELSRQGSPWFLTIMDSLDRSQFSCFSEYELYGNFIVNRFPDRALLEHFLNVSYSSSRIRTLPYIKMRHPFAKSASFHTW